MRVYLSSSFSARESGDDSLMQLRQDLKILGARMSIDVVLGEEDKNVRSAAEVGDHLRILEGCAKLIGESDAFFGMAFERHGTRVVLSHDPMLVRAEVSFFEAELLAACFNRIPSCVVQARELVPSQSMQEFLRLVQSTLGNSLAIIERSSIPSHFEFFCRAVGGRRIDPCPWLFDRLSIKRIRHQTKQETIDPKLAFLGNALREEGIGDVDQAVIRAAITRVESGVDDSQQTLGHLSRLSYLWVAIRELARASVAFRYGELNEPLQKTLDLWNSSAAWHGLHGAHPMGCLAALNELGHARLVVKKDNPPLHPRASAYYSIGTRIQMRPVARQFFRQSIALCQAALQRPDADQPTLVQQQASGKARLAQLGEPWRYFDALQDYKFSFDQRVAIGASESKIGEAQTEYAYALYRLPLPWKQKEAIGLMNRGLELLRNSPQSRGSGVFFRAARKYAEMLKSSKKLDEALAVAEKARDLAHSVEAFDQSRPLQELIENIQNIIKKKR